MTGLITDCVFEFWSSFWKRNLDIVILYHQNYLCCVLLANLVERNLLKLSVEIFFLSCCTF